MSFYNPHLALSSWKARVWLPFIFYALSCLISIWLQLLNKYLLNLMEPTIDHYLVPTWASFQPGKRQVGPNRVSIKPFLLEDLRNGLQIPPAFWASRNQWQQMVLSKGQVMGECTHWKHQEMVRWFGPTADQSHPDPALHMEPGQAQPQGSLLISVLMPTVMSVSLNKGRKGELSQSWAARHREEQMPFVLLQDKGGREMAKQE